ncbi:hypothetical protein DMN50_36265, partial [Priestia megaterium]
CSAFLAGVFVLPSNQQLEATTYLKPTFTITKNEPLISVVRFSLRLKYFCTSRVFILFRAFF